MLRQLTPHSMWPSKICYASEFIQIIRSLWLVDCTFANHSEKCEVQTTSHQKMSLKIAGVLPAQRTSHEVETAKAEETRKAIFLHTGRYNCKWLLVHNFALMRLENLQHFSNWPKIFQLNAILHRRSICMLIFCRRVAKSDITVTPAVNIIMLLI